ncbi:hypothetical protein AAFF_G00076440 [Aldrovandia affinis]|uniref:Uncharacterized protein n=1 Tax=Aldrovandia affinis TaxID=143900 RepID=A0AAD7WD77_9TELE|nr:hypothetical protein AAFF_G00076440 [Aldrovandia affinis]
MPSAAPEDKEKRKRRLFLKCLTVPSFQQGSVHLTPPARDPPAGTCHMTASVLLGEGSRYHGDTGPQGAST